MVLHSADYFANIYSDVVEEPVKLKRVKRNRTMTDGRWLAKAMKFQTASIAAMARGAHEEAGRYKEMQDQAMGMISTAGQLAFAVGALKPDRSW